MVADKNNKDIETSNKRLTYNNTILANTPSVTIGSVTSPISPDKLKETLITQRETLNTYQSETQFKTEKIFYLSNYIPTVLVELNIQKQKMELFKTYLTSLKDNITTKNQSLLYFQNEYTIKTFSSSLDSFTDFSNIALPGINRLTTTSSSTVVPVVRTSASVPGASQTAIGSNTRTTTSYSVSARSAVGATQAGILTGPLNTYNETNEVISNYNPTEVFKNNITVLINTVSNLLTQFDNLKIDYELLKVAIDNYDISAIQKLLDPNGNSGPSLLLTLNNISALLFGIPKTTEILSEVYGIGAYLNRIYYFIDTDDNDLDFIEFTAYMETDLYSMFYISRYLTQETQVILDYLLSCNSTASENANAATIISDTVEVYDVERRNYINTKYSNFQIYQLALQELTNLLLEISNLDIDIDNLNNRITSEITLINNLTEDIENLDTQIITRIENQKSVNTILYISEYERKIYNYTYLTIRIRLKQKLLIAVNNDVEIIKDVLLQLKSQTIPDRALIDKTETNLNAFLSVLNNLTTELEGMVIEYNKIREDFGLDDPIQVTDYEFNDHGLADPNLECFQNLNTFSDF
jgi:hypothetical protein